MTINTKGELLGFALLQGNTDDRNRTIFRQPTHFVEGILVGDIGYISKALTEELAQKASTC